jgi:hypothetical protein
MKKIKKHVYDRLYLEANELKLIGRKKLASQLLNAIGSFPEDNESNDLDEEYITKDIISNTQEQVVEIIVKLCSDLNCNMDSNQIEELASLFTTKLVEKVENYKE